MVAVGGGGGGGGGGGSNDLVTAMTVDRTTASVGGSYVWRITVTNAGAGIAFGVNVDVALSGNMVYGFSQVNRGSGCKPAADVGHYTCNLDILGRAGDSTAQGVIDFGTNVTAVGQVSLSATAAFVEADPTPTNNTVTLTANNSTADRPDADPDPDANTEAGADADARGDGGGDAGASREDDDGQLRGEAEPGCVGDDVGQGKGRHEVDGAAGRIEGRLEDEHEERHVAHGGPLRGLVRGEGGGRQERLREGDGLRRHDRGEGS